jgi:multiple sugar transport system substrate-binding protein
MKKVLLIAVLMTFVITIAFAAGAKATPAQAVSPDTQPYKGQTVTLLIHPTLYGAAGGDNGIKKEFEERTGAKVQVVLAPTPEHIEKSMLDFFSNSGSYDVINFTGAELAPEINRNLLVLDNYIAASSEYDYQDLLPGMQAVGQFNGNQIAMSYRSTPQLIYYRKDLFAAAGLKVPTTWDEVYDVAKALTKDVDGDGKTDIYGFTAAGKAPEELSHAWLSVFYGMGGQIVREDGRSGFNTEAGIKAANLWKRMYQDGILPPDYFAWGRDDFINAMAQGRTAFGLFIGSYYGRFFTGTITPDQVGFAPAPNGGINRSNGWFLTINKQSKNPQLAWELVMALTSKENQVRMATEWSNGPTRTSTFQSEAFKKIWPQADELTVAANFIVRDPTTKDVTRIHEAVTEELTYIMQGRKTTELGMTDLTARVDRILGF